jgi:hypothetical protein
MKPIASVRLTGTSAGRPREGRTVGRSGSDHPREIHDEVRRIHLLGGDPRLVARLADLLRDALIASSQEMSSQ